MKRPRYIWPDWSWLPRKRRELHNKARRELVPDEPPEHYGEPAVSFRERLEQVVPR